MLPTQTIDPNVLGQAIGLAIANSMNPTPGVMRKALTGAAQGPYIHGPGGLFGVRGLSRGIISTFTQMQGSLGEILPIRASNELTPLFPYITGFVRSDTQEKNAICDDPEEAGHFLTCLQTTIFGRKEFKSRELVVTEIGNVINRGEFTDLLLENGPLVEQMGGMMRNFVGLDKTRAAIGGNEIVMRMIEMSLAFQRWFCPKVYTGNPANSSAGGGYKEFMGLDMLIGTNKIDAQTGAACPGLYSDVKSFSYRQIDSLGDPTIHRTLSTMMYILEDRAVKNNLSPVQFALVMRAQLFWELSRIWPLQYNTQDTGLTGAGMDMLYLENTKMRDAMRQDPHIMINAKRYRVILDDCIFEENRSVNSTIPIGGFASDIYIVPLSARGGSLQTLYWEYKDFKNDVIPQLAQLPTWFWSDNGTFMWTMSPPLNWCMNFQAVTIPRLILRTPQLAGRLTDVVYVPLQHTNDPLPSQYYHINGGVAGRTPPASPFSEYNPAGPGIGS